MLHTYIYIYPPRFSSTVGVAQVGARENAAPTSELQVAESDTNDLETDARKRWTMERTLTQSMDGGDSRDSDFGLSDTQLENILGRHVKRILSSSTEAGADEPLQRVSDLGLSVDQLNQLRHRLSSTVGVAQVGARESVGDTPSSDL